MFAYRLKMHMYILGITMTNGLLYKGLAKGHVGNKNIHLPFMKLLDILKTLIRKSFKQNFMYFPLVKYNYHLNVTTPLVLILHITINRRCHITDVFSVNFNRDIL